LQFGDSPGAGNYRPGIITTAPDEGSVRSVTLHEMQHPIQRWEGFASGGNPDLFKQNIWQMSEEDVRKLRDEVFNKKRVLEFFRKAQQEGTTPQEVLAKESRYWGIDTGNDRIRELLDAFKDADEAEKFWRIDNKQYEDYIKTAVLDPNEKYRRLAGEAESRLVEARRNLTAEQRGLLDPIEQMDAMLKQEGIAGGLNDLIVRYGDDVAASAPIPDELPFGLPERIQAFRTARANAALPVEQGGLGLGPANTAAERARAGGV
jgi:hypothetical protein